MYRRRLWTMRQYAGFGTAAESNARYRYLLSQGQTGLSVAFDLPTQLGYDSDNEFARGEVGKVGVAVASLRDMETLFADIPLDKVSVSMTINATAAILLALYVAVARRRGLSPAVLSGTVQNDILKEYAARGNYIYPAHPSMRLAADIIAWCSEAMPKWNPISISGYHIREAGSTAVQEVAFTLANAIAYVEEVSRRGLPLESFVPRLSFFFNASSNLFEEVAKFRAARRLWAKIVKGRFGARDRNLGKLRFHTQTSGATLTAQQPENNVVRVTLQALAAVLGGTQSLHTNAMDEALGLPTEQAALTALRTQQVIAHESGAADTIDPMAGSYYLEHLTDAIERRRSPTWRRSTRWAGRSPRSSPGSCRRRSTTRPTGSRSRSSPGGGHRGREPLPERGAPRAADPQGRRGDRAEAGGGAAPPEGGAGRGGGRQGPWEGRGGRPGDGEPRPADPGGGRGARDRRGDLRPAPLRLRGVPGELRPLGGTKPAGSAGRFTG